VLPDMVRIKAGKFLRGSAAGTGLKDAQPQRWIHIDTFDIDRNEVTVTQYSKCVQARRCAPARCMKVSYKVETRSDHPVVCVTWYQAKNFCQYVGKRLPTEAEWEKAARGTKGLEFPWGNQKASCKLANYRGCHKPDSSMPVGQLAKGASPSGVLDMAGNVHEWVADWHSGSYYATGPARNPTGPSRGTDKVLRGGSFVYGADELNTHGRTYIEPLKNTADVGIRCARSGR
jgi:formylglycine-generating enzyme required for sulfatase activity